MKVDMPFDKGKKVYDVHFLHFNSQFNSIFCISIHNEIRQVTRNENIQNTFATKINYFRFTISNLVYIYIYIYIYILKCVGLQMISNLVYIYIYIYIYSGKLLATTFV